MPSRQGRTAIPQRRRRGEARCSLPKGTNGHQPSDQENQIRAKVSIDCCLAISKTSNGPETGSTEDRVLGTQFESSRLHHAFRLSKRFPGCPVTSAQLAELWRELRLCQGLCELPGDVSSPLSLRKKFGFPETETPVRRDAVRMQAKGSRRPSLLEWWTRGVSFVYLGRRRRI